LLTAVITIGCLPVSCRWALGAQLGEGAYARVYAALNRGEDGRRMAVKVMKVAAGRDVAQLQGELALYARLAHPHVVAYLGSCVDNRSGRLYIGMEYAEGGSVARMLSEYGAFPDPVARSYVRQILLGLDYLHAQKIVHRDLKGANILVTLGGVIKLADFGAARVLEAAAVLPQEEERAAAAAAAAAGEGQDKAKWSVSVGVFSLRGSVFWISPEMLHGRSYGRRADIWSLGCVVIEMLTGKHPWPELAMETTPWSAMFKIAQSGHGPPRPEDLSDDARSFLDACLSMDPAARPTAAQLLDHPWVKGVAVPEVAAVAAVATDQAMIPAPTQPESGAGDA
jgi:serine/threonine protein kinase